MNFPIESLIAFLASFVEKFAEIYNSIIAFMNKEYLNDETTTA